MNEITIAIIGLIGSLISVGIVEIVGWKKVLNRMGDCKTRPISERFNSIEKQLEDDIGVDKNSTCLTAQHKEIQDILKKDFDMKLDGTLKNARKTYELIKNETELKRQKEYLLAANEYKLSQAIDEIMCFKNLWLNKNEEVQNLTKEIVNLQKQLQEYKRIIEKQSKQIEEFNTLNENNVSEDNDEEQIM